MQLSKKVMYAGIISAATLITSIFIPIIPCKTAPGVPNPIYSWTLCSLNPDKIHTLGTITEYLGYTTSLSESYILVIAISFIISLGVFHFLFGKKRH